MPANIMSFKDLKPEGVDGDDGQGGQEGGQGGGNAYSKRTTPKKGASGGYIYHELQESRKCGQHCLNNLLQQRVFTEGHLADIAAQLDKCESMITAGMKITESGNIDATGNFSIEVLKRALKDSEYKIDLVAWGAEGTTHIHPLQFKGIIVNKQEHWFSVREINGKWYNLNSTHEWPHLIPSEHMEPLLHQMRGDGFQIFLPCCPRGTLPLAGVLPPNYRGDILDGRYWIKQSDVDNLPPPSESNANNNKDAKSAPPPAAVPFSGRGNRLDGKADPPLPVQGQYNGFGMNMENDDGDDSEDADLAAAIAASLEGTGGGDGGGGGNMNVAVASGSQENTFDADLARAIALSQQEAGTSDIAPSAAASASVSSSSTTDSGGLLKTEKEIAREKRLAAMAARGL